jgi:hypothetical protein
LLRMRREQHGSLAVVLVVHTIAPMPAVAVRDVRRVDPPGPVAPACRSAVGGRRVGDRVELEYKSMMAPTASDDPDVVEVAQEDVLHPGIGRVPDNGDPYAVLEASNRAYLEAYRRNAKLMALLEQVANIDPNFRELRRRRGEVFTRRNARGIADLQKRGIADPELDPTLAAQVLSSMSPATERKGAY